MDKKVIELFKPRSRLYEQYGDKPFIDLIMSESSIAKELLDKEGESRDQPWTGLRERPFDFDLVNKFKNSNIHHSTCIETKKESSVGIGFEKDGISDKLDSLCDISFQDLIGDCAEDYAQVGNGYIEVVRNESNQISGLHHLQPKKVLIYIEDDKFNRHYYIEPDKDTINAKRWARFGDKEAFLKRRQGEFKSNEISEVIHFRRPTSLNRWYGFPDWLAAVASIELVQCLHQYQFDFFMNRGVPEFLLFFLGSQISNETWTKIEESLKKNIGLGNSFKSSAFNIPDPNMKVQLDKLAMENKSEGTLFSDMNETLALNIVSAHRVPPLLAGIQIPGKLAATNELPNALMAFQILVIGPMQHSISTTLDVTLGNPVNGIKGLKKGDFIFKKITDLINIQEMDTISRMREPLGQGNRDPADGLKKEDEELSIAVGSLFSEALKRVIKRNGNSI